MEKKTTGWRLPLLPRIIIAIVLGVLLGNVLTEPWVRVFLTFNGLFSELLGFLIPLIIVGLVTAAIADIGHTAGRLLLLTVALAFVDTMLSGFLAYGTGLALFPGMLAATGDVAVAKTTQLAPYFEIKIPAMMDVMSALVLSFVLGLGIAYKGSTTLRAAFGEFRDIVSGTIQKGGHPSPTPLHLRHLP